MGKHNGQSQRGEIVKKNKMSKEEMKVAVAKDVIALIRTNKIKATSGEYFSTTFNLSPIGRMKRFFKNIFVNRPGSDFEIEGVLKEGMQLQDVIPNILGKSVECEVCARGAAFLAYVKRFNNVKIGKFFDSDGEFSGNDQLVIDQTRKLFGKKQVQLIETAFELRNAESDFEDYLTVEENELAQDFGNQHPREKERLVAIMKNIVKNKGVFKP